MPAELTRPNQVDKHVGSRVRMRRMMLGFSQEKVADALGFAFQQLQKYEKGTNRISASRLHQLASILQVPVPFFFDGAQYPTYATNFLATQDGLTFTKAFMRIEDATLRRGIVRLIQEIANDAAHSEADKISEG